MQRAHALIVDTHEAPLPQAMREVYLADLQAHVVWACRNALRSRARHRVAAEMLDAFCSETGSAHGFRRWDAIGPHAALRREFGLSKDATKILLFVAAPKLWHILSHVYAALSSTGRGHADIGILEMLTGDRQTVLRELCRESPLVACGLVSIRATGAIVPGPDVVLRLAS